MKKLILKKLTKYYTKILRQENVKQEYIDNGWQYDEDMSIITARIYYFNIFVKDLQKILNEDISKGERSEAG